jgi:RimJ/RimL family protein N-acetyltransferase
MRLEPLGEQHLDALRRLLDEGDPDLLRFTRIPEPVPPDFARTWLAMYEHAREEGSREAFAALGDDDELLGLGFVPTLDRDAGEAELGYVVGSEHRGRGVASAILRELTAWVFAQGIERAELFIDVRNPASERVAQRAGYVREGTLRSVHHKAGQRIDAAIWSRLPSDPDP